MGIIYKATNQLNGKIYVGKTTLTLEQRRKKHQAVRNAPRQVFQAALVKYGFDAFHWEILENIPDSELDAAEMRWIAELNATDPARGYNRSVGGDGGRRGFTDTPEVRKKKAQGMLGNQNAKKTSDAPRRALSAAHKAALSAAMVGRKHSHSQETKDAISRTMTGRTLSQEHRDRIAEGVRRTRTKEIPGPQIVHPLSR